MSDLDVGIGPKEHNSLVALPWTKIGKDKLALAWRAIKMVVPQCEDCQRGREAYDGWQKTCPHNPYYQTARIDVVTPIIKCNVCDERVPEGVLQHCDVQDFRLDGEETMPKFVVQPNTREVRIHASSNSGNSLAMAMAKGWKLPTEFGIAQMCEFSRCYEPNPTFRGTDGGMYCSQEEANLIALVDSEEATEVFHMGKRRGQLREAMQR